MVTVQRCVEGAGSAVMSVWASGSYARSWFWHLEGPSAGSPACAPVLGCTLSTSFAKSRSFAAKYVKYKVCEKPHVFGKVRQVHFSTFSTCFAKKTFFRKVL